MNDITITFVVLALVVALFVIGRIPVGIIAIGTALALYATGVITMEQALAGFGDPTVVFIAALFVVSEALDATGVTTWAGEKLLAKVGESRVRLVSAIMLLVAALTALISVNGAVAALVPMVVVLAVRLGKSTSQTASAVGICRPCRIDAHLDRNTGQHHRFRSRRGIRGRCFRVLQFHLGRCAARIGNDCDRRTSRSSRPPPSCGDVDVA